MPKMWVLFLFLLGLSGGTAFAQDEDFEDEDSETVEGSTLPTSSPSSGKLSTGPEEDEEDGADYEEE